MVRPSIPERQHVVALCEEQGPNANILEYDSKILIKYGTGVTLAEAMMQEFVHANADHNIVYTPEVYDYFIKEQSNAPPIAYIVMEKVNCEDYVDYRKNSPKTAEEKLETIAKAVRHIWDLPLPAGASIGPLGGQIPFDRFFSDYGAGQTFKCIADLEYWINQKLIDAKREERVDLQSLKPCICHLDLTEYNVLVGDRVIILDWGMSGIYPPVFEEFALFRQFNLEGQLFAKGLHKRLFGPRLSPLMRPLAIVSNINQFGYYR